MNAQRSFDVVIIGGAMMGSSVAWWLRNSDHFSGSIAVIEADPSFATASTSHTNSCMRQQFGSEINIKISQFGAEFVAKFQDYMGSDAPKIPIQNFGYMYLATSEATAQSLRDKATLQQRLGAGTKLYSPAELATKFPFYNVDDVVLASHNTQDEGYFDGGTVFDYFRKARDVSRIHDTVTGLEQIDGRVTAVHLQSGETLSAGCVVNAAGPRADQIMRMAGLSLPVEPRKRFTWVFQAADPLPSDLPLTIDPSGVHFRSDGMYYMAGCAPLDDHAVDHDDFAMDHDLWESHVWPIIANRIPQFERIKVIQEWAGHYAYNTLDQNAILGPHPDVRNLYLVNGFSGHGLQQAPAVGRGIAEHIATGSYQTLDLSPLGVDRIAEHRMVREHNVI